MSYPSASLAFDLKLQAALTVEEISASYVTAVKDVIFARGRGLYRLDPQTNHFVDQVADVPNPLLDEYAAIGVEDDPVLRAAVHGGRPVTSSDAGLASAWPASRARRVLEHFGYAHSLKAPLVVGDVVWGSIHFTRYDDDPPFDDHDRHTAAHVVGHLGAALTRALRHEQVHRRAGALETALDCVTQPVVITDRFGNHVLHNAAAGAATRDGRRVLEVVSPTIHQSVELINSGSRRVVTAQTTEAGAEPLSVRSVALTRYGGAVSLVYSRHTTPTSELPELGILSKREQEIALLVSQGLSTKEIAARAFITENTVKQHLKRIFSKLNVCSRAEMVHALWAAARPESTRPMPADHERVGG
ncbi:hypothetical protein GCM10027062_19180 [Nocardioides hungaricus]